MDCTHRLTLRQVIDLMSHFYFGKPINYTCACGKKCELTFKPEYSALCWAAAILVLIIALCILMSAVSGINLMLSLLMLCVSVLIAFAAYFGMVCLFYRLNKFEFTAIEYRSIVDRKKLNKR